MITIDNHNRNRNHNHNYNRSRNRKRNRLANFFLYTDMNICILITIYQ